jgi:uncharacterized glyoxalase superfamily protein PhnB
MTLKNIAPMLWTRELKATADFYVETLGFSCNQFREDWGWASLRRDGVHIIIARPYENASFAGPAFTGSLYIYTENIDALWEELRNKVKVCDPIKDFFHNLRGFAIYDNNGYLLQFSQQIAG